VPNSKFAVLVLAAIAAGAPSAYALQAPEPNPTSTAPTSPAPTSTAPPTKIQPSLGARKKATEYGFHAEVYDGKTMFCKQDAALGSRIKSTRCMGAYEFEDYAVQLKIARDMMQSKTQCQGGKVLGGPCGGIP
jgi:hypothetical protein